MDGTYARPAFGTATEKPLRGKALIKRKSDRLVAVAKEQKAMLAAKVRDGHDKCRNPRCTFKKLKLPIDACHAFKHRGSGGNPRGDRTSRELIIAACRGCHGLLDAKELMVEALDKKLKADGALAWYRRDSETGRMVHYATEQRHQVSVTRAVR